MPEKNILKFLFKRIISLQYSYTYKKGRVERLGVPIWEGGYGDCIRIIPTLTKIIVLDYCDGLDTEVSYKWWLICPYMGGL